MSDETQMIVFCEGCGEAVAVDLQDGPTSKTREPASEAPQAMPGRVTISQGPQNATIVHVCPPGAYFPPDQKAPPKR